MPDFSGAVNIGGGGGAGHGVQDLYPSEKNQVRNLSAQMMRKHSFRGVRTVPEEEQVMKRFDDEMRARCAELGLQVEVQWYWQDEDSDKQSPDVSENQDDHNLYWNPRVIINERITPEYETDHDKMQYEIRAGYDGGTPGVIDPTTGEHKDEPSRKHIY